MGERVTITHPRRHQPRARRRAVTAEIDAQTQLGAVYMRSLLRAQLRLGIAVGGLVLGLLGLLPIVFALAPTIGESEVLGIPLPWLALGILVYPALVAAAWFYVRHAERNERDFVDLVHRR
jgi:hypothetical protein